LVLGLVKWLYLLALGVWLGAIVFFSFVGAPAVFRAFPEGERALAGRVIGGIFPGYYRLGYGCGAVLVVTSVALWVVSRESSLTWGASALLAAIMLSASLYAGMAIQPRASELRPRLHEPEIAAEAKDEFDRLHRLAVQLNVVSLVGALAMTALAATKLRP